jgi:hypothetical protein
MGRREPGRRAHSSVLANPTNSLGFVAICRCRLQRAQHRLRARAPTASAQPEAVPETPRKGALDAA